VGPLQDWRDGLVVGESRGGDRLHREGRVPELRAVVALHLHPVLCQPDVVEQPRQVRLNGLGLVNARHYYNTPSLNAHHYSNTPPPLFCI